MTLRTHIAAFVLALACGSAARADDIVMTLRTPNGELNLDAGSISSAEVRLDDAGSPEVFMRLSADGARSLAALTAAAVGQQMEVLICGKNVLSPIVQEPIVWGSIVIIGPGAGLAVEQLDVLQGKAACPVGP